MREGWGCEICGFWWRERGSCEVGMLARRNFCRREAIEGERRWYLSLGLGLTQRGRELGWKVLGLGLTDRERDG